MAGPFQIARYPQGFNRGVSIREVPIINTHSRNPAWWVDSNSALSGDGTFTRPFLTVDTAINASAAGDLIMVKENHAETLTTSNTVTMDVAGVSIVGLGYGQRRPRFTFTPSAVGDSSWTISAASCSVENIIGIAGLDAVTKPFSISGAACSLDIEWQDGSSTVEAETVVLTTTAADQITINLTYRGFPAGDACVAPIKLNGATDARVNVDFYGKASTAVVNFVTTLSTNVLVTGYMYNSTDTTGVKLVVDTIGSSLWYADIYAGAAGQRFKGGSAATIAGDPTISAVTDALYGANGVVTWPAEAAAANAVSMAEVLLYIQNAVRRGSGTTLAANKSIADALGTDGSTVTDGAVTVLGAIGANNANNAFASNSVVANNVGSVLERLHYIQTVQAEQVVAFTKADVTAGTAWSTGNSPITIFTITGDVLIKCWGVVTTALTSTGANGTLALGFSGGTGDLIAATTIDGTILHTAKYIWTSTAGVKLSYPLPSTDSWIAVSGSNVILTVATNNMSAGGMTIYCLWKPISSGATVV